jgi:hypothetical protein
VTGLIISGVIWVACYVAWVTILLRAIEAKPIKPWHVVGASVALAINLVFIIIDAALIIGGQNVN